jgi:hypothetical protein
LAGKQRKHNLASWIMQLIVVTPEQCNNKSVTIDVDRWFTIQQLRQRIEDQVDIPTFQQRLLYDGRPLANYNLTVSDYGIANHATLHLTVRLVARLNKIGNHIVAYHPLPDSCGVQLDSCISVIFDSAVLGIANPDACFHIRCHGQVEFVVGTCKFNSNTRTLTFTPATALQASHKYYVELSSGSMKLHTQLFTLPHSYTFTTEAQETLLLRIRLV